MKNKKGITLISLVITIVVLIILLTVAIYLTLGNNGILNKAEQAKNETIKQTATEKINLKITNMQIEKYTEEQRMPTLQEFADGLCEDNEIQYVQVQSKKVGSLSKIEVGEANSIFTKLKEYPYEFEINSSLQLASIDGVQLASNDTIIIPKDEYNKLKNANRYSTEEIEIGTWLDGKTLYRKIYIFNDSISAADGSGWKKIISINDIEDLVLCTCKSNSNNKFPNRVNNGLYKYEDRYIQVYDEGYGFPIDYIIIEYTKTTDSAN